MKFVIEIYNNLQQSPRQSHQLPLYPGDENDIFVNPSVWPDGRLKSLKYWNETEMRLNPFLLSLNLYFKIPALCERLPIQLMAKFVSEMPLTTHNQREKSVLGTLSKRHRCFQNKHCEKAWWSKKL